MAEAAEDWLAAGRVGRPHGLDGSFHVTRPRRRCCASARPCASPSATAEIVRRAGHRRPPDPAPAGRDATATPPRRCAARSCSSRARPRPPLDEDEWWAEDLEGCAVVDGERPLGHVRRLRRAAVVRGARGRPGGGELLVPLVRDAVRSVDVDGRRIDVDPAFLGEGGRRWRAADAARHGRAERCSSTSSRCSPSGSSGSRGQRHVANALAGGHELRTLNPREHTPLSGGQVDDTPFGGGAGMVLRVDVMDAALRGFYGVDPVDLRTQRRVIALTPGGRMLDDRFVDELAAEPAITLLCGRYEGFDERIVQHFASDAVSIGRYVLAGGELAAMVVCDAVLRKLPGRARPRDSALEESFSAALGGDPEYPHYTRPAEYRGWSVPEVLLSGHHEEIRRWRRARSRERGASARGGSLP